MKITIEKIVYPGKSMGRGDDGIATFTEGSLPNEIVEICVVKNKKSFKEARLLKVLKPSEERVSPQCPSFGVCGGCSFQYTGYDNQLKIKQKYVNELLDQFGTEISVIIASPQVWEYRNKMEFSFFQTDKELCAGLHKKGEFSRYVPVSPCLIADKDITAVLESVISFARKSGLPCCDKRTHQGFYRHVVIRKAKRTGQILANIVTNADSGISREFFAPLITELKDKITSLFWTINTSPSDAVIADELIHLHGKETIEEELRIKDRKFIFSISPFSFFQTNTFGTEKLYEVITNLLCCGGQNSVLDLYCGTGTIGIVISPYVKKVLGVEQVQDAVKDAQYNSRLNRTENVSFQACSVEEWIKEHKSGVDFDTLILDPPRSGISNKVADFISETNPEKIIYVSCNPSTIARDLKSITGKSTYQITDIIPIDMFPQTYHVEVVVSLKKIHI